MSHLGRLWSQISALRYTDFGVVILGLFLALLLLPQAMKVMLLLCRTSLQCSLSKLSHSGGHLDKWIQQVWSRSQLAMLTEGYLVVVVTRLRHLLITWIFYQIFIKSSTYCCCRVLFCSQRLPMARVLQGIWFSENFRIVVVEFYFLHWRAASSRHVTCNVQITIQITTQ